MSDAAANRRKVEMALFNKACRGLADLGRDAKRWDYMRKVLAMEGYKHMSFIPNKLLVGGMTAPMIDEAIDELMQREPLDDA